MRREVPLGQGEQGAADLGGGVAHQADALDRAVQRCGGREVVETRRDRGCRQRVGVQADGHVRHVFALRVQCVRVQAGAQRGQRSVGGIHMQEGRRGEALQAAEREREGRDPCRFQRRDAGLQPGGLELVRGRLRAARRKAAQRQGDVRLATVAGEQQSVERALRGSDARAHLRAVHVDRPQQVVRPAAMPLVEVAALVAQGQRFAEKVPAQRGGIGHAGGWAAGRGDAGRRWRDGIDS